VALVRTDISEVNIAYIFGVKRIIDLGPSLAVISDYMLLTTKLPNSQILSDLITEEKRSSETSVLTGTTRRHIPEDASLHNHSRENLKFYIALTGWTL
jgi:hypothetical protein